MLRVWSKVHLDGPEVGPQWHPHNGHLDFFGPHPGPMACLGGGGAGKHGPGSQAKNLWGVERQSGQGWEWARHSPPAALSGHSHLQSGRKMGGGLTWPLPPLLARF